MRFSSFSGLSSSSKTFRRSAGARLASTSGRGRTGRSLWGGGAKGRKEGSRDVPSSSREALPSLSQPSLLDIQTLPALPSIPTSYLGSFPALWSSAQVDGRLERSEPALVLGWWEGMSSVRRTSRNAFKLIYFASRPLSRTGSLFSRVLQGKEGSRRVGAAEGELLPSVSLLWLGDGERGMDWVDELGFKRWSLDSLDSLPDARSRRFDSSPCRP